MPDNNTDSDLWTDPVVIAYFEAGNTGSILENDDGTQAKNYIIFTLAAFAFFMALYYIWEQIFEKVWILERYHDKEEKLFKKQ